MYTHTCRSGIKALPHNAKMHYNYANLMADEDKIDCAIYHYEMAVR